jgi:hypothetical protein
MQPTWGPFLRRAGYVRPIPMAPERTPKGRGIVMNRTDGWTSGWDDLGPARRRAVIGRDIDDEDLVWDLGGRLSLPSDFVAPPVRLAPVAELTAAARSAPAMTRMARFVEWVGKGRSLDDDGDLSTAQMTELVGVLGVDVPHPSDDPELERLTIEASVGLVREWAELADVVDTRGTRLVPIRASCQIDADPLTAWHAVFEARLEIGVVDVDGNGPPWGQAVDDAMADLVVLAHLRDDPVSVADLAETLWAQESDDLLDGAADDSDIAEGLRRAIADDVERLVDALVELGVVTVDDGALAITPLGAWAAVQLMRDDGYNAPVIGERAAWDATRLLDACGEMDPEVAAAELSAWLAARSASDAVAQLADAARAGEVAGRSMFYFALDQLGPEAAGDVRTLQDDPVLRPYATAWLIERDLEEPQALTATDVPAMMVDQLAVALAAGGAAALIDMLSDLGPASEQVRLVEAIWRVEGPAVGDVLEVIGRHHDAKTVAKAARRARFKRRSAGLW